MAKPKADGLSLVINEEFIDIISRILKIFKGDIKETKLWLTTGNLFFGGIVPLKLIVMGRGRKIIDFIENAEHENTPPDGMEIRNGQLVPIVEPREWTINYAGYETTLSGSDIKDGEIVKVREILVDTPENKNDAGTKGNTP